MNIHNNRTYIVEYEDKYNHLTKMAIFYHIHSINELIDMYTTCIGGQVIKITSPMYINEYTSNK